MNINLPYKKLPDNLESNAQTTINIINGALAVAHKDGLDGNSPYRRMYARLQAKFDEALENDKAVVGIDENEKDFIVKALKEAKLPITWSAYLALIEDELARK